MLLICAIIAALIIIFIFNLIKVNANKKYDDDICDEQMYANVYTYVEEPGDDEERTNSTTCMLADSKINITLHILNDSGDEITIGLRNSITIGSGKSCNLRIASSSMKSKHAILERKNGKIVLKPYDSSCYVAINSKKIVDEEYIFDRAYLEIGDFDCFVSL